jgi:hypothetical protein
MKTLTLLSNANSVTTGTTQKAASFYVKSNTQTVATTGTFVGTVTIQGTLAKEPTDNDYFNIQDITASGSIVVPGNFTFLRAKVTAFTSGTITTTLSY